jgi:hypothetical protein
MKISFTASPRQNEFGQNQFGQNQSGLAQPDRTIRMPRATRILPSNIRRFFGLIKSPKNPEDFSNPDARAPGIRHPSLYRRLVYRRLVRRKKLQEMQR